MIGRDSPLTESGGIHTCSHCAHSHRGSTRKKHRVPLHARVPQLPQHSTLRRGMRSARAESLSTRGPLSVPLGSTVRPHTEPCIECESPRRSTALAPLIRPRRQQYSHKSSAVAMSSSVSRTQAWTVGHHLWLSIQHRIISRHPTSVSARSRRNPLPGGSGSTYPPHLPALGHSSVPLRESCHFSFWRSPPRLVAAAR